MRNKKLFFAIGIFVGVGWAAIVFWYLGHSTGVHETPAAAPSDSSPADSYSAQNETLPTPPVQPPEVREVDDPRILNRAPRPQIHEEPSGVSESPDPGAGPSVSTFRKEVSENPHSTPPSLVKLAEEMGPKMSEAKKSYEKARDTFEELERCVAVAEVTTAKALCYSNAKDLAALYSELKPDFESLTARTPAEVIRLVNSAGF